MRGELGVPFLGNKSKIVKDLLETICQRHPDMTDFYDLCGGGGCISFSMSEKNPNINVYYNELRTEIFNLIDFIKNNQNIPVDWWDWVSREDFYTCRDKIDAKSSMIKLIWSFGNRGISGGYLYGKDIVNMKYLGHQYAMYNDSNAITEFKKYNINLESMPNSSVYDRRIALQNEAKKVDNNKMQLEHIQRLERVEQCFANVLRLQHIERLEKLEDNFNFYNNLTTSNKSYEEVIIQGEKPILYLDIPYKSTKTYDGVVFDYEKFYEWAKNCKYPVYFSEFEAPEYFECVWSKERFQSISSYQTSRSTKIEKLFWNGVK